MGSLVAALGSWLFARHAGSEWLLRMEDIDPPREVPGAARQQLDALTALGLVPDGPVAWQSARSAHYAAALARLVDAGLAFQCQCSRNDLAATGGIHRHCVARPSGTLPAIRLRIPDGVVSFKDRVRGTCSQQVGKEVGDVVLRRADGLWAYHLAVVVDDALQGITEVVRGADLLDSTPRQILLQRLLGYPTPVYAHLPIIREADGHKLGKSIGSAAFDPARPVSALASAYAWLGQDSRHFAGEKLPERALALALANFDPARVPAGDRFLAADQAT